jgi:hypothetical protein
MSHYWDEAQMKNANATPSILAIGDSWFWYPFVGGSLVNNIGDIVDSAGHVVLAKGMNGAEAYDYVDGKYARSVREALRLYGSGLSAVLISGGGNDFAGFNDLRPLLKDNCSAEITAKGCFRAGAAGLQGFFQQMDEHYRKLIGIVYTRTSPSCLILMHAYDYAIPDGRGVFGGNGWLKPALVSAQVPAGLHQACVTHLIDCFYKMLVNIASLDPSHLFIVDSRGTLRPSDWANELHPKGSGFSRIANTCWKPVLRNLSLAN